MKFDTRIKLLFVFGLLFLCWSCKPGEELEIIELSVSIPTIDAPPEGGSYKVAVTSNIEWSIEIDYENYSWCSVEGNWHTGDTIYIHVTRSNSESIKQTKFVVRNTNTNSSSIVADTVIVTQAGWSVPEEGVLINGTIWAKYNVDNFGSFTETPYQLGKLYQFNSMAGYTSAAGNDHITDAEWSPAAFAEVWQPENNPCPPGWRLPTLNEVYALIKSGYRYNAGLNGFFFGPHSSAAYAEDSKDCVFIPAGGFISNGSVEEMFLTGRYWVENGCSVNNNFVFYRYLQFYNNESENGLAEFANINTSGVHYAFSIRCVKE